MKNNKKKLSVVAICLLLTVVMAIGGTVAYIFTQTNSVVNTFTPPTPDITVVEEFDGKVKNNVAIKNTGDVDSFIRAKVVITWQDSEGNVYPRVPVVGSDYTITWNVKDNVASDVWVKGSDDFYYYTTYVPEGDSTGILFTDAEPLKACADENYTLYIEIIAQSVQSTPDEAVSQLWTLVTAKDGVLTSVA